MRILIGTHNVGNNAYTLQEGFKRLGIEATVALITQNHLYQRSPDIDLSPMWKKACEKLSQNRSPGSLLLSIPSLLDYDIYIFISSFTLLPGSLDLPILRQQGKLIISWFPGSDTRYGEYGHRFNQHYGHTLHPNLRTQKTTRFKNIYEVSRLSRWDDSFVNKLHNIRMAEKYSHCIMSNPCANVLALRPYMALVIGYEAKKKSTKITNNTPVIVHAPTCIEFKRTDIIIPCIFKLWATGHAFEFKMLRNVSNTHLLKSLKEADILVDQIACGKTGLLGLEGMATGTAVMGCNDVGAMPIPLVTAPVIRITERNIYDTLSKVIRNKSLRQDIINDGIKYSNFNIHNFDVIAQHVLTSLERSINGDCDYYPTQYSSETDVPRQEVLPEYLKNLNFDIIEEHGIGDITSLEILKKNDQIRNIPDHVTPWNTDNMISHFWGWQSKTSQFPFNQLQIQNDIKDWNNILNEQ
jgi:hypothetical protein